MAGSSVFGTPLYGEGVYGSGEVEAGAGGAEIKLGAFLPTTLTIEAVAGLTTAITLVGTALVEITAKARLLRPLAPIVFSTDASLQIAATQWDAEIPDHKPFVESSDDDRANLKIGLKNLSGEEFQVSAIQDGWVDEWTLQVNKNNLLTRLHGRDPMAAILDYTVHIQYIRDALRGALGGTLVPNITQVVPQFLDPFRALNNPPPLLPQGFTRKIGRWTASMIAADLVSFAGLGLSWQVPDYSYLKDFDGVGRIIDLLMKLIDPFVQVEPFKADVFVVGKTVVVRKRRVPTQADYTYKARDSRIENLSITKRRGPIYGHVHITGAPNKALANLQKPGSGTLGEAISYNENGAPVGRVTFRTLTRAGDDAMIFQERYTYGLNEEGNLVIQAIETTLYNWETILEDPETGAMLNRPVVTGSTTVVQARDAESGLIDTASQETKTNTYDSNKFLVGEVASRSEKNPETGGMRVTFQEFKTNQQGAGGTVQTTSTLRGDPPTLESAGTTISAGRPFGGPGNSGGGQTFAPYEIELIIDTDPLAVDFEYRNDFITPEIINMMLDDLRAASGLYQYVEKFTGVAMPWLQKNVGLFLTDLFSPHTLNVVPEQILLEPALVTQVKDTFNEGAKPPVSMADVEAVFWRAT